MYCSQLILLKDMIIMEEQHIQVMKLITMVAMAMQDTVSLISNGARFLCKLMLIIVVRL